MADSILVCASFTPTSCPTTEIGSFITAASGDTVGGASANEMGVVT